MIKEDCFAAHKTAGGTWQCKALKIINCKHCSFYKTLKENEESICKSKKG